MDLTMRRRQRQRLCHGTRRPGSSTTLWDRQQHRSAAQIAATTAALRGRDQWRPGQKQRRSTTHGSERTLERPVRRQHAPDRGDRVHSANQPKNMSRTKFKAPISTKWLLLSLNHLHHTQESILGYQPELKHDTIS